MMAFILSYNLWYIHSIHGKAEYIILAIKREYYENECMPHKKSMSHSDSQQINTFPEEDQ